MSNPKMRFYFREPMIDTNLPLVEGTVQVDGFDLEVTDGEWDAIDHAFGALVEAKERGEAGVAIPAYPNRKFRQSYLQSRTSANISAARDLVGRNVGILAWSNSAGVWFRGALENYYGVDLRSVNWVATRRDGSQIPDGISIEYLDLGKANPDHELDRLLLDGKLDAVLSPNVLPSVSSRDQRTGRVYRDYCSEEQRYYRETGIFPISHVVTLKREFVERYPDAPVALLKAYREARDIAIERISGSDPVILTISWAAYHLAQQQELMGEHYWPYNIEDNRTSLEAMLEYSYQQGITSSKLDVMSFFDPTAAALAGY
ncbi:MAG TPA: hypothetical protein VMU99_06655 [Acidimicrobiales bacterium]|nr:hypothetical protein [Acidimicrobiales bacterium]